MKKQGCDFRRILTPEKDVPDHIKKGVCAMEEELDDYAEATFPYGLFWLWVWRRAS